MPKQGRGVPPFPSPRPFCYPVVNRLTGSRFKRRAKERRMFSALHGDHADDDFSSGVSLFEVADGLWNLGERVSPVDDWCNLPGFDELLKNDQVLVVLLIDECAQLLAHQRGQHHRPELAIGASEPTSSPFTSNDDESSLGSEGAPEACQRGVSADVEDQLVVLRPLGEVLACVVDDMIRPDGSDHLDLRGAANTGYLRTERLGKLHGVGPHS